MRNKMIRIIATAALSIIMLSVLATNAIAEPPSVDADYTTWGDNGKITSVGSIILGVATTVGMVVAVIMLVFLAIKYMSSSPNDKAEIKKHMVVWIVGAVLLFAASGVVKLIQGFGETVSNTLG